MAQASLSETESDSFGILRRMTVGARLKELRKSLDLTQEGFTAALNKRVHEDKQVTRGAVGNWERDQGIKRENVELVATAFNVSFEWLSTGRGSMKLEDGPQRVPLGDQFDPDHGFDASRGVWKDEPYRGDIEGAMPDIDVNAGAGPGGAALAVNVQSGAVAFDANAVRGELVIPPYLLKEFTHTVAGRVHVVRVKGDSMEPTFASGDRVFVDTTDRALGQGGHFVLLDPDGEVLVKRLRKAAERGRIEVVSDNPQQGTDLYAANEIQIIGRVVARLSRV